MNELIQLLLSGGAGAVIVAVVGAISGRYPRKADYTKALVETARGMTADADKRAKEIADDAAEREQKLEEKIDRLEAKVNNLGGQVGELSDLLRTAIPLLQAAGHDQIAAEMRAALVRRAV